MIVEKNGQIFERLVRPSKKDPNKKLFYITIENMFEPVYKVHQDSQHGARDATADRSLCHKEFLKNSHLTINQKYATADWSLCQKEFLKNSGHSKINQECVTADQSLCHKEFLKNSYLTINQKYATADRSFATKNF